MDTPSNCSAGCSSFVGLARARALQEPERRAYTFLDFAGAPAAHAWTYRELDERARTVAAVLEARARPGDRAMLVYPGGLEFLAGFLGCLYAGVVAVPVPVPANPRGVERLRQIIDDAQVSLALSTLSLRPTLQEMFGKDCGWSWLFSDALEEATGQVWREPVVGPGDLAFLQYSSGSTGSPRGVMVRHGNLLHNLAALAAVTRPTPESCSVSWLPTFHDMGLILGVLQPLFGGYSGVLMAPEAFLRKPYRWLKAVSDSRADISVAPNFAYQMCADKLTVEQCRGLDLSRWRVAFNGAEPVRADTLEKFAGKFAPLGFRREAFFPAYGLAEGTLMVSGGGHADGPLVRSFSASALEQNRVVAVSVEERGARRLVGCGAPLADQELAIVHPQSGRRVGPAELGEIWVSGPSVGGGYWRREQESREGFGASLGGKGTFLRTGDVGFVHEGELFICGRLKDLIVIRGNNHHPSDLELTVESCHPAFRPSAGAAFSVEVDQEERVVVAHEVRGFDPGNLPLFEEIVLAVRRALAEEHGLQVQAIALLRPGGLPKTTSGKVQRQACRAAYLQERLSCLALWTAPARPAGAADAPTAAEEVADKSEAATRLERWFVGELARTLGCEPAQVDTSKSVKELGLSGEQILKLTRAAEMQTGSFLPTTLLLDFANIDELARHVSAIGVKVQGLQGGQTGLTASALAGGTAGTAEPIAIIGIGCRFPRADSPAAFWKLLREGMDAVTEVPAERWDIDEVYDPNPLATGKMNTRCGGFLRDIDRVDRNFFNLSIREAVRMDPQHRLMLEVAWDALEDAGIVPSAVGESETGVFVGISGSDYAQMQFSDASLTDAYAGIGCALTIAASRVSYYFNLRGPAVAVDTACSSSCCRPSSRCA